MAAKRDAKLVLVARNEDALQELADEINAAGGVAPTPLPTLQMKRRSNVRRRLQEIVSAVSTRGLTMPAVWYSPRGWVQELPELATDLRR